MKRVVSWARIGVFALLVVSCKKETPDEALPAAAAVEAAPAASGVAPAAAAPSAAPAAAFDPCVIGSWRATSVTMKADAVKASGGGGVTMQIGSNGATTLDFGSMSDIAASGSGMSFDFRYAGKATGTLKTPTPGKFESSNPDYSKLTVTANVKVPGAGTIPMFKNTPMSDLVKMASGVAAAAKGAPGTPAAAAAGGVPKGIDAAPIFSSSTYECRPESLKLSGEQNLVWEFVRSKS